METTKDAIKAWMKKFGHSRVWLGEQCGPVTLKAVNNWLSTDRSIPITALLTILRLMVDDESRELKALATKRAAVLSEKIANADLEELEKCEEQLKRDEQADEDAIGELKSRIYGFLRQDYPEDLAMFELLDDLRSVRCELDEKIKARDVPRKETTTEDHDGAQCQPSTLTPMSCLSLPVDVSEFNAWGEAALRSGKTVTKWAIDTLRAASSSRSNSIS